MPLSANFLKLHWTIICSRKLPELVSTNNCQDNREHRKSSPDIAWGIIGEWCNLTNWKVISVALKLVWPRHVPLCYPNPGQRQFTCSEPTWNSPHLFSLRKTNNIPFSIPATSLPSNPWCKPVPKITESSTIISTEKATCQFSKWGQFASVEVGVGDVCFPVIMVHSWSNNQKDAQSQRNYSQKIKREEKKHTNTTLICDPACKVLENGMLYVSIDQGNEKTSRG